MIREYEASEFIAMIALNELLKGHNSLSLPVAELINQARRVEQVRPNVRINISSNSIQSFHSRIINNDNICIQQEVVIIRDIKSDYIFFRRYASEFTLSQIFK